MITAVARRRSGFTHDIDVDGFSLVADEPADAGGADEGPSPRRLLVAALASCTAVTIEMYAERKGWELGEVSVEVRHEPASPSENPCFDVEISIGGELDADQRERVLKIAGKCPVHRVIASRSDVHITDRFAGG